MIEKKYNITFNERDFVDTSKYDNFSLEELNTMLEKQKNNYNKYIQEIEKEKKEAQ